MAHALYRCPICDLDKRIRSYDLQPNTRRWDAAVELAPNAPLEPGSRACVNCYRKILRLIKRQDEEREEIVLQPGEVLVRKVPSAQHECCVCHCRRNRKVIPAIAIAKAWMAEEVLNPEQNRCCPTHLRNGSFERDALDRLVQRSKEQAMAFADFKIVIANLMRSLDAQENVEVVYGIDFDNQEMNDEQYKCYTGFVKSQFDELVEIVRPDIRNSSNRSVRNALGVFLCKLRMNFTQNQLGHLFSMEQPRVSGTIKAVLKSLHKRLVPLHLGCGHITREDFIKDHMTVQSTILSGRLPDAAHLISDCTYNETEASANIAAQKGTWSQHKHYNLLKPMVICAPDGYILDCHGPYLGRHNDAEILKYMLRPGSPLRTFLKPNDVMVLDRGFRDVIEMLIALGYNPMMPNLLRNKKQFTAKEANESRIVTKIRWVVEAVNGKIKNRFSFFRGRIPNHYLKRMYMFQRVACALLNKFFVPFKVDRDGDEEQSFQMLAKIEKENELQAFIIDRGFDRQRVTWIEPEDEDFEFPRLTEEDIKSITMGVYQLKNAPSYVGLHMTDGEFKFYVHRDFPDLLRVKCPSRFRSNKFHNCWIKYQPGTNGPLSILGYYCQCQTGARTIGCCSHVASVLWYMGFARHLENLTFPAANITDNVIDLRDEEISGDSGEDLEED